MYAIPFNTFYSFGDNEKIGQHPVSIANEELTWETTTEVNVGLELGFWQDRLTLNADVYNKITDNLLLEAPVVNITGYEKAWQNIGKMRNRQMRTSLNHFPLVRSDFQGRQSRSCCEVPGIGRQGCISFTAILIFIY